MKIKIIIVTLFILFSCQKKQKTIDDNLSIEIIGSVFSSDENKIFDYKKCSIAKQYFPKRDYYVIMDTLNGDLYNVKTFNNYLTKILKIKDSSFVKKQLENGKHFSFKNLEKFKFKVYSSNINKDNKDCVVFLSPPIFNEKLNKFYIIIGKGSSSGEYLFTKDQKNKWSLKERISLTME